MVAPPCHANIGPRRMVSKGRAALLAAGLCLACAGAAASADDFEAGLAAFRAGHIQTAHDIWLPLAQAGDVSAQYSLGKLYEKGDGVVSEDFVKAVSWYKLAAAQGLPQAQNDLALMYAQGRGGPADLEQATKLWRQAAEQNYPWAQFNLGIALFRGQGVAPDQAAAAVWFERAAEAGLAEAQFILGQLSQTGLVLEQSQSARALLVSKGRRARPPPSRRTGQYPDPGRSRRRRRAERRGRDDLRPAARICAA